MVLLWRIIRRPMIIKRRVATASLLFYSYCPALPASRPLLPLPLTLTFRLQTIRLSPDLSLDEIPTGLRSGPSDFRLPDCLQHPLRCERHSEKPGTGGVENRIANRSTNGYYCWFTTTLRRLILFVQDNALQLREP